MQRGRKWAAWGVVVAVAVGAYLYWLHDWRPSCRNVPSAAAATEWLNGLSSEGKPFMPDYVACIEFAAFSEIDPRLNIPRGRDEFPHPGIGVKYTSLPAPEGFAKLKDLPRLAVVEFRSYTTQPKGTPGYADAVASAIGQYNRVVALAWGDQSGMTDAGLRHLARIETLERLYIIDASLGAGITALAALPRLQLLDLRASTIAAPGVAALAGLRRVTELKLDDAQLAGDLAPIARMPSLRRLSLRGAKIGEDQIATLSGAPALLALDLQEVAIGPRGMAGLAGNPKLEAISFARGKIAGGFENLARAPALARLSLFEAEIDDARAAGLAKMTRLEWLRLSKTAAGDATVAALASLPRLEYLDLSGTAVTDAALSSIAKMPRLREVYLGGTKVSDAGRAKLKAEKPDLKIGD